MSEQYYATAVEAELARRRRGATKIVLIAALVVVAAVIGWQFWL